MKNLFIIAALTLSFSAASKLFAASEYRLGIVDIQRAIDSVEEGKSKKESLEKEFKPKGEAIKAREEKMTKMKAEADDLKIKERSGLLKPAEISRLRKLEEDWGKEYEEYLKARKETEEAAFAKQRQATDEIVRKLRAIIQDLGREGSYTNIFEKNNSGLLYAAEQTDLTEKAIQKYNAQYKGKGK